MSVLRTDRGATFPRLMPRATLTAAVLLALLVGTRNTQDAVANGDTRTITLYHNHTRETLTVTFRKNGQYDPRALEQLNWFLRDWRQDEPTQMDPRLFDVIWAVYREVGSSEPIHVNSAYRSPSTNAMLRRRSRAVAKHSQHMRGKAMDFFLPDVPIERIRAVGMRLQEGGVGYYPSAYTPFVHLDVGSVRAWPRMTRDQLARIFPDGKTVHIPADGEPMPRYEEAKAEILARGGTVAGYTQVAEADGEAVAAAPKRKGFWATLFGFAEEDEDADEVRAVRGREVYVARRAPPPGLMPARESDSVYAALDRPRPAPTPVRLTRPAPPPAPPEPVVAALQEPVEPARPAVPPTRIAGLPQTVDTPQGPQLSWQQGPAAASTEPVQGPRTLAFAPMPPPRPEDPVTTGALSLAPLPPPRPGARGIALASLEVPDLRGAAPAEPLPSRTLEHPLPPPRPGTPPILPLAQAARGGPPQTPSKPEAKDREKFHAILAASLPAGALAPPASAVAVGFSHKPGADLSTGRFSGPAVKALPVLR